jgi:hypothetical protein
MATTGLLASLGVVPCDGVRCVEVLNDFERLGTGRLKPSNLVVGMTLSIVVRLAVGPRTDTVPICSFRLA